MPNFFKHLFTGADNSTFDIARVLLAAGMLTFLLCAVFDVVHNGHFDAASFGMGFGAVMTGGGAGIALKSRTEPPAGRNE